MLTDTTDSLALMARTALGAIGLGQPEPRSEENCPRTPQPQPLSQHKSNAICTPLSQRLRGLSQGTPLSSHPALADPAQPSSHRPPEVVEPFSVCAGPAAVRAAAAAGRERFPIGTTLFVYWEGLDEWYATKVVGYSIGHSGAGLSGTEGAPTFQHRCEYDGCTVKTHDLSELDFQVNQRGVDTQHESHEPSKSPPASTLRPRAGTTPQSIRSARSWLELELEREEADYAPNYVEEDASGTPPQWIARAAAQQKRKQLAQFIAHSRVADSRQ